MSSGGGGSNTLGMRFSKSARRRGNSQESASNNGVNAVSTSRNTISGAQMMAVMGSSGSTGASSGNSQSNLNKDDGSGSFVSSKTGFLTKRAMSSMDAFANWKERFFVLAEGHMSYYKQGGGFFNTGKDDIVHLKGEVELTADSIVRNSNIDDKPNCFEIVTSNKKMYAQASTAKEREDWVKSIRAHINALKRAQQQQQRGSFQDASPPAYSAMPAMPPSGLEDYSRPSMLEDHEIVRGADKSTDPKDVVIKQLLEENRQLREQLTLKDQVIHELEMNGGRAVDAPAMNNNGGKLRTTAPQMILDLRDVKKKQFQLFDAAEVGNWHLIATLLRDNVIDVNGVGINQTTALHLAARMDHPKAVKELLARGADVGTKNGDSYTALHLATSAGNAS